MEKNQKIEEILNSLQLSEKATPRPYLLTRVNAAIADRKSDNSFLGKIALLLQRPAFAISLVCVVLLVNAFFLFNAGQKSTGNYDTAIQASSRVQEFAINVNSLYDLENSDQ